ncbi:Conserved oligomeric Golgi complex subunit 4 [Komagataella phaffii CBS 7435]|uniref:Conserved oligomeric Golgi complex subunit 4 n=2 Tax=Komagataella phaffii TaxID=460519 RepID=C4QWJ7_KOMPG|nr:Essential component of the conserved oligomeric Golgi complex (Cog1p through Cog8p) [Komagataella phaffii GS115]AOA61357.1 GQ67_02831T0 [Komagataella phaffii]CAH2446321.1 Conserved oligomeric Golgi complex subunit 4 [Komagataella phaffii CBS 7435]AOA66456.1 GQ68_02416T0 [Komagataella phaffii GS115]CAY67620.1 Essential component of the conserved oligomeric Golgi complex (Cog1p through Cog8p) [Komagataella phaffii GS115]CCA36712.1 Conserved oligomeric Golgi complex subunit 4 [Komagataella pha
MTIDQTCQSLEDLGHLNSILSRCSNVNELQHFIHVLDSEKEKTDTAIRTLHNSSYKEESASIRELELKRVELSGTLGNMKSLVSVTTEAHQLGDQITTKVKYLDQEKTKVLQTYEFVNNVQVLKTELANAHLSIQNEDWLKACESINVIRQLPDWVLTSRFVNATVPTSALPDEPKEVLEVWIKDLSQILTKEFDRAASERNPDRITYYFKLFPLVGQQSIGIKSYSSFICNIIHEQSRLNMKTSQGTNTSHAFLILKLFETISNILIQHSNVIKKHYEPRYILDVMQKIQNECDLQCGLIFDTFWDTQRLDRVVNLVREYDYPVLVEALTTSSEDRSNVDRQPIDERISLSNIGDLLNELALILNRWSMYCKFFSSKWNEFKNEGEPGKTEITSLPEALFNSAFMSKIKERINPVFDTLSTFYLRRSLEKAYEIEEFPNITKNLNQSVQLVLTHSVESFVPPSSKPASSLIDDLVFVLNNIYKRAVSTGQSSIINNLINSTRRILETNFLSIVAKELKETHPRYNTQLINFKTILTNTATASRQGTPVPANDDTSFIKSATTALQSLNLNNDESNTARISKYLILLNSISLFDEYLSQLVSNLLNEVETDYLVFLEEGENRINRLNLKVILENLTGKIHGICDASLTQHVRILYTQVFKPRLTKLTVNLFAENEFLLTLEEFDSIDSSNSDGVSTFLQEFTQLTFPYYAIMTQDSYNKLIAMFIDQLSKDLEEKIWSLENKCNELGLIKLERSTSALITSLTKLNYKLRDRFVRVTQIIMVSNLGDDEEIDNLGEMHWVLTPTERLKARNLRVDR